MALILPILIPFITAALALLCWKSRRLQRLLGVTGTVAGLGAGIGLFAEVRQEGNVAAQMGDWPAPYGITLVADHFSAVLVLLAATVGVSVAVYSIVAIDKPRQTFAYYPLLNVLLMGVSAAFLTGDLFNLYVWFEVLLIASFVLLSLGSERRQLEGAIKYVTLNLISSFLFLTGIGILYGAVGTLNMADISQKLRALGDPDMAVMLAMLFLVAFGIKAALFPLFFWLPASYHTPPAAVSAVFGALLTKVGIYSMIRMFTLLFGRDFPLTDTLVITVALLTMVTGVLGAIAVRDLRRVLSFQVICGVGYMILGLGIGTSLALAGTIFYMIHSAVVTAALFLVAGLIKSDVDEDGRLSGLANLHRSWIAAAFGIPAMSMAGIPPLSGFFPKLMLIRASIEAGRWTASGVAVFTALLVVYSLGKVWARFFWEGAGKEATDRIGSTGWGNRPAFFELASLIVPIAALTALTMLVGFFAGDVYAVAETAADQLLDPEPYISIVLGGSP